MRRGYKLEAAGVLAGAVLAGTWAGVDLASEIELERSGVVVPAKVLSVEWERKSLQVDVEFTTRDGKVARSVLDTNEMGGKDDVPRAADVIDIRYDPDDPSGSATKATRGLYFRYISPSMLAVLAGGLTWWSLRLFRKRRIPKLGPVVVPQDLLNWPDEDANKTRPGSSKAT